MASRNYTEEEIQDLTDRVFLLKEHLEAGKMHFAPHLVDDFKRSYGAIRLRPDGLVDPSTVDGRIRAATLAIRAMKQRDEAKESTSLGDIQEAYFTLLFREFGWLYDLMTKAGATPAQVAKRAVRDSKFVQDAISALPALAEHLNEFWQLVSDAGAFHLQDGQQLKATFGGDLFPAHSENTVSTAGLYVDTIVLPCPITRIAPLVKLLPDREVVAMFVKHTLTAMSYREIAIADVAPPIALVLPNINDFDADSQQHLVERAASASLKHAEYIFDRHFESLDHLQDFCTNLATIDDVMAESKRADRILFDTEWNRDPRAQLTRAMSEGTPVIPGGDQSIAGNHVFASCLGRMPQAMAIKESALHFGGTPLINAETSWLYYTWMLEYEAIPALADERHGKSLHIVRALVAESQNNLAWLGNVPPETVLEIRKRGLAGEIRELLGHGVGELIGVKPNNYFRTADQVVDNLDRAFRQHQKELMDARQKKLKLYGLDLGSFVVTGTVAVASALTGNTTLGAISAALGMAGLPNLKDIRTKFSAIAAEDRARRASPTGLLFRHATKRV